MSNYLSTVAKETTLIVENEIQKFLWENYLVGQISDGYWENTKNSGWQFWCNINCEVGNNPNIKIPNCYATYTIKKSFGFTRLIKYIGEEMLDYCKKIDKDYNEKKLRKDLQIISKIIKGEYKKDI